MPPTGPSSGFMAQMLVLSMWRNGSLARELLALRRAGSPQHCEGSADAPHPSRGTRVSGPKSYRSSLPMLSPCASIDSGVPGGSVQSRMRLPPCSINEPGASFLPRASLYESILVCPSFQPGTRSPSSWCAPSRNPNAFFSPGGIGSNSVGSRSVIHPSLQNDGRLLPSRSQENRVALVMFPITRLASDAAEASLRSFGGMACQNANGSKACRTCDRDSMQAERAPERMRGGDVAASSGSFAATTSAAVPCAYARVESSIALETPDITWFNTRCAGMTMRPITRSGSAVASMLTKTWARFFTSVPMAPMALMNAPTPGMAWSGPHIARARRFRLTQGFMV